MFSCEICEISKNTFFTEHFWASASELLIMVVSVCQVSQKKNVINRRVLVYGQTVSVSLRDLSHFALKFVSIKRKKLQLVLFQHIIIKNLLRFASHSHYIQQK